MKVVWLCHFSNSEVRDVLKPCSNIRDISPWIPALARLFIKNEGIEIHIVSPHEYISGYHHWINKGIHYHFFNAHIPYWGRHWPGILKFDYWTDFIVTRLKLLQIIKKINPDLIHLHGAEIAYFSSGILQFKDIYPVLVTIQGFIINSKRKRDYQVNKCIKWEKRIIHSFTHFGYRTRTMGQDILKLNPKAVLHWHHYPFPEIKEYNVEKKYDIVFFARITKEKGIEDLLESIAIIKKTFHEIKLLVIGPTSQYYLDSLKNIATRLDLTSNIEWAGFLQSQEDVHKKASEARICVLPTYNDIISGTIIESMFLKLPVVAYDVGSIHEINNETEYVSLVPVSDIEKLVTKINSLLIDDKRIKQVGENGYQRAKQLFSNDMIVVDIKSAYKKIISDFDNSKIT